MYVAITRARGAMEINVPLGYHVQRRPFRRSSDRHLYAQVSRYLTDEVQTLMDTEHAGEPVPLDVDGATASAASAVAAAGRASVVRFLSGLWA